MWSFLSQQINLTCNIRKNLVTQMDMCRSSLLSNFSKRKEKIVFKKIYSVLSGQ